MAIYINTNTQEYPLTLRDIKNAHNDTAFPPTPSDSQMSMFGYMVVVSQARPAYNENTHKLVEGNPVANGGHYLQTWNQIGLGPSEIDNRVISVRTSKSSQLRSAFNISANADVMSGGFIWNGGSQSALIFNGKAETLDHRSLASGGIHDIDNVQHTLTPNAIRDVAADISEAYESAFDLLQAKKNELAACGDDITCMLNVSY